MEPECPTYPGGFKFNVFYRHIDEDLYDKPLHYNIYTPFDEENPYFVTLTLNKDQVFIPADVVLEFLDREVLENYWVGLKDDPAGSVPFFIWDVDGKQYKKKTSMWIPPSSYQTDQAKWVEEQLARWKTVVVKAILSGIPGAFFGRLLNPFKSEFLTTADVVFTPRYSKSLKDLEIDADTLRTVFLPVLEKRINGGNANVMSYADAKKKGFRCIGGDLFNFYLTWVHPRNYEDMWGKLGVAELALEWPNETKAKAANDLLATDPFDKATVKNDVLNVRISMAKIIACYDVEKRDPDQQQVMGKSATDIFETFWPMEESENRSEWLHRSAFHFGGIEKGVDPQSSQSWKNLIFGTKESNTDMIRAETAIGQYLSRYAEMVGDGVDNDQIQGVLKTVNNRTEAISRMRKNGTFDALKEIPKWVAVQKYRWLSFKLEYTWTMSPKATGLKQKKGANLPLVGSTMFDPFSQYRPFQIEGQLDTALIEYLFTGYLSSTSLSGVENPEVSSNLRTNDGSQYITSSASISLFGVPEFSVTLVTYTIRDPQTEEDKAKSAEMATVTNSLSLTSVFPSLANTPFESISFQNCTFLHQNFEYDDSKDVGWHVSATWLVDSSSGSAQSVLKNVLGVEKTTLSVYGALGTKAGWDRVLDTQNFLVEGMFAGLDYSPGGINWIHVTSIGARLFGVRMLDLYPEPVTRFRYGFGVFGTINFDLPGSVTPLEFRYDMTEFDDLVSLSSDLSGDIWNNALGIEGLTLRRVEFATSFALSSPWESATFDISAAFLFRYTTFLLRGSFASKTDYSLTASITNFSLNTIKDIYEHIAKKTLVLPDVDVTIGSATISITSAKSLTIALQNVQVNGHTSANALLTISPSGVVLRGDLTSSSITFADIELKKAFLQVQFAPASSPLKTDVSLGGEIEFSGLTFDAAVHLYKDTKGVQWTVFASLTANNDALGFKTFLPGVSGTCLENVALRQVAFIAASKDEPYLGGNTVPGGYKIHQGVQVWATITTIDAIHDMARHDVNDLVLSAAWSKAEGFVFDVIIPSPIQFNIQSGVRSEPIKLEIRTNPVRLVVSAGLSVQVPASGWLTFRLLFNAGITDATIAAEMDGTWNNPFGISSEVSVSNIGLQVRIVYAQFFATGTPSGFAIRGGLALGATTVDIALSVDEDPTKELISAKGEKLSLTDLVTFARQVTHTGIPYPPDILGFRTLSIYICTGGCWIGSKYYPPGFAFSANGTLCGNDFDISCAIQSGDVTLHAGLSNFYLWAVTLNGVTLDGAVGPSRQFISVAGSVSVNILFATITASASFYMQLWPSFKIDFHCSISFSFFSSGVNEINATGVRSVTLKGTPVGEVSHETASQGDIALTGHFEDGLVDHLQSQMVRLFDTAQQVEKEGYAAVRARLDQEKEVWDSRAAEARSGVDLANEAWRSKRDEVIKEAKATIAEYDYSLAVLQDSYKKAFQIFNGALDHAKQCVQAAEYEHVVRVRDARYGLEVAEREMNMRVLQATRVAEDARKEMFRVYGDAPRDLETARLKVQSLGDEYDNSQRDVDGFSSSSESWTSSRADQLNDIAASINFRKSVASRIVGEAESIINSEPYKGMQSSVDAAHQSLTDVQRECADEMESIQAGLQKVIKKTKQAIEDAQELLSQVETGEAKDDLQKAVVALVDFKQSSTERYNKAHEAIRDVEQLTEFQQTKVAEANLAAVHGELADLQAVVKAVEMFQEIQAAEAGLAQWVMSQPSSFAISGVQLAGDMSFFGEGVEPKPLKATVKSSVMGIEREVEALWSPDADTTSDFHNDVFKSLCAELSLARTRA